MELISREEAIDSLCKAVDNKGKYEGEWLYTDEFVKVMQSLPTVEERKEGEWIHSIHYGLKLPEHRCSICGEWEYSETESNFCPNCGAKMKGE